MIVQNAPSNLRPPRVTEVEILPLTMRRNDVFQLARFKSIRQRKTSRPTRAVSDQFTSARPNPRRGLPPSSSVADRFSGSCNLRQTVDSLPLNYEELFPLMRNLDFSNFFFTWCKMSDKGPCTNDVSLIFGIFDPPLPLSVFIV